MFSWHTHHSDHYNRLRTNIQGILVVLFTLIMIAALAGAIFAHASPYGLIFGTAECSLSLLTLVIVLMSWIKHADPAVTKSKGFHTVVLAILLITFGASVIGVFLNYFGTRVVLFGSMESSLSLLAFALTAKHVAKQITWMSENC